MPRLGSPDELVRAPWKSDVPTQTKLVVLTTTNSLSLFILFGIQVESSVEDTEAEPAYILLGRWCSTVFLPNGKTIPRGIIRASER